MDPRPSPQEVEACFASPLTDDVLWGYLRTLQADPNWQVISAPDAAMWSLTLLYSPTGARYQMHLERVTVDGASAWQRVPSHERLGNTAASSSPQLGDMRARFIGSIQVGQDKGTAASIIALPHPILSDDA